MTEKKFYLILQSVLCVALVIILILLVTGIYREGLARKAQNPLEWIYTRELVEQKLAPVIPLLFLSLGIGIGGIVLGVKDENAEVPVNDPELNRNLIVSRVAEPSEAMKKEQAKQKKLFVGGWAAFAVCLVPIVIYVSDGSHFPDGNLELMIASLAVHVLPWMVLAIACLMISGALREKSIVRETEAAKAALREAPAPGGQTERKQAEDTTKYKVVQIVLIAAAVVFIIAGIFNGSARDVLYKAAKICTECVGLG